MKKQNFKSESYYQLEGKQARSRLTQTKLLDAAETLFLANGLETTTVADIAKLADVSIGAFYHHFGDKKALTYAMFQRITCEYSELSERLFESDSESEQKLDVRSAIRKYLDYVLVKEIRRPTRKVVNVLSITSDSNYRQHFYQLQKKRYAKFFDQIMAFEDEIGHPEPEIAVGYVINMLRAFVRSRLSTTFRKYEIAKFGHQQFVEETINVVEAYLQLKKTN